MHIFKKISYSQTSLFAALYTLLCLLYTGILTRFKEKKFFLSHSLLCTNFLTIILYLQVYLVRDKQQGSTI